jgi:hypothetical protein
MRADRKLAAGHRLGFCSVDGQDLAEAVISAGFAGDCLQYRGRRNAAVERPEASGLPLPDYCHSR